MKVFLAIAVTLAGFGIGTLAEEKQPSKKPAQYNPKEVSVEKKGVKWSGPEYDAAKSQPKAKQKTKGKK